MNINEWFASPDLVKSWREDRAKNQTLQMALGVMDDTAPVYDRPNAGITETFALYNLGFQQGYAFYAKKLAALATHADTYKAVESTYEPEPQTAD